MKYLYTALILVFMSQGGATAQEKKSGFFDKVKTTFSSEIKIGTHTFKDGSVYRYFIENYKLAILIIRRVNAATCYTSYIVFAQRYN